MNRRVIFLDIDGVLAPILEMHRYGDLDRSCVEVLNEIVVRGDADVVVSSSLRFGKTAAAEWQQTLAEHGFTGRVIDTTPTGARGLSRGEEIAAWLEVHTVAGFVILDDHRDLGGLLGHLVQTAPALGLRPSDADRAVSKLLGEQEW